MQIALVAFFSGAAPAVQAANIAGAVQSTVRVQALRADGSVSVGSGVALAGERVVTACHVLEGAREYRVVYLNTALPALRERRNSRLDMCTLSVPDLKAPPATVASSAALSAGAPVIAFNGAVGVDVRVMTGVVEDLHPFEGAQVIETSIPFAIGDSGGGLFNNDGQLVGLLAFVGPAPREARYAIPMEWLEQLDPRAPGARGKPFWQGNTDSLPSFLRDEAVAARRRHH